MPGAGKTQHSQRGGAGDLWSGRGSGRGDGYPCLALSPCHSCPVPEGHRSRPWGSQGGAACRPWSESEVCSVMSTVCDPRTMQSMEFPAKILSG